MMKSNNWNGMKNMSVVELNEKLGDLKDKIFKLKFHHSTTVLKNPLVIRWMRRDIARIKTLLAQKKG
jgi:large subunit ribosomal protein L29